jgi:hypothetical protein
MAFHGRRPDDPLPRLEGKMAGSLTRTEQRRRKTVPVPPETHYAESGDVSIAYQVVGDGPFDVIVVPGFVSHVELGWGVPFHGELRGGWRRLRD